MKVEYMDLKENKIYKAEKVISLSFGYGFVIVEFESKNSMILDNKLFQISRVIKEGSV